jgi:hypothetical protein
MANRENFTASWILEESNRGTVAEEAIENVCKRKPERTKGFVTSKYFSTIFFQDLR